MSPELLGVGANWICFLEGPFWKFPPKFGLNQRTYSHSGRYSPERDKKQRRISPYICFSLLHNVTGTKPTKILMLLSSGLQCQCSSCKQPLCILLVLFFNPPGMPFRSPHQTHLMQIRRLFWWLNTVLTFNIFSVLSRNIRHSQNWTKKKVQSCLK